MRWKVDPSRIELVVDARGVVQATRNKATLQAEILRLLADGPRSKTSLMVDLQTSIQQIDRALSKLQAAARAESFTKLSARGRMDVNWCLPGQSAAAQSNKAGFHAAEILAAFQIAAAAKLHGRSA